MNEKIGIALQSFNFFDQGDIFYRKKDCDFFHKMFKDLLDNGKSLVMTSQSKDLLEYYGQALIARIRKHTKFRIELYFPSSTDDLLTKFNKILSSMSVAEAREQSGVSEGRILVVQDANKMNDKEIQLMSRLITDFPGANIKVFLLIDDSKIKGENDRFKSFAKKATSWVLEQPTEKEALTLLRVSEKNGFNEEAKKFLQNIGIKKKITRIKNNETNDIDDFLNNIQIEKQEVIQKKIPEIDKKKNKKIKSKNLFYGFLVLFASVIVVGGLYIKEGDFKLEIFDRKEKISPIGKDLKNMESDLKYQTKNDFSEKIPLNFEEKNNSKLDSEENVLRSLNLIINAESNNWMVQHGAYDTLLEGLELKKKYIGLKNAMILPTNLKSGKRKYVVISGPFSKVKAIEFTKEIDIPDEYYVRTVRSLITVIPKDLLKKIDERR